MKAIDVGLTVRAPPPVVVPLTVRETVVEWVNKPEVPVMVMVEVPAAAVLLAARVSTLLANVAVTPVGIPEAPSATAPVKPPVSVVVIVLMPLAP